MKRMNSSYLQKIYCGKDEYLLVMKITYDLKYAVTQYEDVNGSHYLTRKSRVTYDDKKEIYQIHRDGKYYDITHAVFRM
jgi:hypothetical protein